MSKNKQTAAQDLMVFLCQRENAEYYIPGSSAPPDAAVQIWGRSTIPSMVARLVHGASIKAVMDWAKQELEGFRR